jgi:DNA-binding PadR family transcriptional regulator
MGLPRPIGTIGGTKLKILATIHHNELQRNSSYGYAIWMLLKNRFHLYMEEGDLRNVYRHLKELDTVGLIKKGSSEAAIRAPKRQTYLMTEKGRLLKERYEKYLNILQETIIKNDMQYTMSSQK